MEFIKEVQRLFEIEDKEIFVEDSINLLKTINYEDFQIHNKNSIFSNFIEVLKENDNEELKTIICNLERKKGRKRRISWASALSTVKIFQIETNNELKAIPRNSKREPVINTWREPRRSKLRNIPRLVSPLNIEQANRENEAIRIINTENRRGFVPSETKSIRKIECSKGMSDPKCHCKAPCYDQNITFINLRKKNILSKTNRPEFVSYKEIIQEYTSLLYLSAKDDYKD